VKTKIRRKTETTDLKTKFTYLQENHSSPTKSPYTTNRNARWNDVTERGMKSMERQWSSLREEWNDTAETEECNDAAKRQTKKKIIV